MLRINQVLDFSNGLYQRPLKWKRYELLSLLTITLRSVRHGLTFNQALSCIEISHAIQARCGLAPRLQKCAYCAWTLQSCWPYYCLHSSGGWKISKAMFKKKHSVDLTLHKSKIYMFACTVFTTLKQVLPVEWNNVSKVWCDAARFSTFSLFDVLVFFKVNALLAKCAKCYAPWKKDWVSIYSQCALMLVLLELEESQLIGSCTLL